MRLPARTPADTARVRTRSSWDRARYKRPAPLAEGLSVNNSYCTKLNESKHIKITNGFHCLINLVKSTICEMENKFLSFADKSR